MSCLDAFGNIKNKIIITYTTLRLHYSASIICEHLLTNNDTYTKNDFRFAKIAVFKPAKTFCWILVAYMRSSSHLLLGRDFGGQVRVDLRPDLVGGLAGKPRQHLALGVVLQYRTRHLRVYLQPPPNRLWRVVHALHQRLAGHVVATRHLGRVEIRVVHPSAGRVYPPAC